MTTASLTFVPWVRQGVASAIATVDSLGPSQHAVAQVATTLLVNGEALQPPVTARLRGPADVMGLDARQIVRTEPPPDCRDHEPGIFASIEFDRADMPWLFTPAAATTEGRLRPWLALVVVREQPGVTLAADGAAPLPRLIIEAPASVQTELPNPADAWAWAHAQAASDNTPASVQAALGGAPSRQISRLICPRLLAADTDYLACLVPLFEMGRRTGLGIAVSNAELVGADALATAWAHSASPVTLPVYHHWRFRTGAGGDFYTLATRLAPRAAPPTLGQRPLDVAAPGFALPADFPSPAVLAGGGALLPISQDSTPAPWPDGTATAVRESLASIVNAPGLRAVQSPNADPLLAPPLYGQWHARRATVSLTGTPWFDELNLDPRWRTTAALGTAVVQKHQEALVASAWTQAGDLQAANQRLRQLQLSQAVGGSLAARHLAPMAAANVLSFAAPMLASLAPADSQTPGSVSMRAALEQTAVNPQSIGWAARRIGRVRGPLTRRVVAGGRTRVATASLARSLNSGQLAQAASTSPSLVTVDAVNRLLSASAFPWNVVTPWESVTEAMVAERGGLPWFVVRAEGTAPTPGESFVYGTSAVDSPAARDFRAAAKTALRYMRPERTPPSGSLVASAALAAPVNLAAVKAAISAQIQPRLTLAALSARQITRPRPVVASLTAADDALRPIAVAPRWTQPMVQALLELAPDALLPGLATVPPDSVVALKTNRRFVDAYLVGLNNEMAHELRWRGYPAPPDATFFDSFWGGGADIMPIKAWGDNALGSLDGSVVRERFVMLVRGALLQRHPNALIGLVPAEMVNGVRQPATDPALDRRPVFDGELSADTRYFGFDITPEQALADNGHYLVIQQHPTEPRFGLHPSAARPSASHLVATAPAPTGQPLDGREWGRNAAHMAEILRRRPLRLAIHLSRFFTPST
jgi:hypothetical protein